MYITTTGQIYRVIGMVYHWIGMKVHTQWRWQMMATGCWRITMWFAFVSPYMFVCIYGSCAAGCNREPVLTVVKPVVSRYGGLAYVVGNCRKYGGTIVGVARCCTMIHTHICQYCIGDVQYVEQLWWCVVAIRNCIWHKRPEYLEEKYSTSARRQANVLEDLDEIL